MSRSASENEEKPSGGLKRKATVAPGYLRDLLQARQRMKSMGLKAAQAGGSGGSVAASTTSTAAAKCGSRAGALTAARQEQLYVAPATLPLLFAQRKKYLLDKRQSTPQPYRLNEELPVGLLSLPEDVLLKIMCYLRHDEIKPLFQVCKSLNHTLRTAVHFHFNYATPFRDMEGRAPPPQRRDPNKKRSNTNLAAVLAHLTRSGRLTVEA
ncbi:hypothetical protein N2152v2_007140 [Parachlorella kessleri]